MLSSADDPELNLFSTCHLCLKHDGAILQCLYLLSFMPHLFLDIACNIGRKLHLHLDRLSLEYPKARSHKIFQIKLLGDLKVLPCLVQHLDPVQGKYPRCYIEFSDHSF